MFSGCIIDFDIQNIFDIDKVVLMRYSFVTLLDLMVYCDVTVREVINEV